MLQFVRGARVPVLSADRTAYNALKQCGTQHIQSQESALLYSRVAKRSYNRACLRASRWGSTMYKGRVMHSGDDISGSRQAAPTSIRKRTNQAAAPSHCLRVFSYNAGGLGSGMYEELMHYLDTAAYDIVLTQETKMSTDTEYCTDKWICIGSGTAQQKHAGVTVLISKAITHEAEVKHDTIVPGRLIRVRFPVGKLNNVVSVLSAYLHAWNPKDPQILNKRLDYWQCLNGIPRREHLVIGGDLNVQVRPRPPHIGPGTGLCSADRATDEDEVVNLLDAHSLIMLNTWSKPGHTAHTFKFGTHSAQLDYIIVRRSDRKGWPNEQAPCCNALLGPGAGLAAITSLSPPSYLSVDLNGGNRPLASQTLSAKALWSKPR